MGSTTPGIPYSMIGRTGTSSNRASGHYYEILVYNERLSDVEITIVNNYLQAKYGNFSIANDVYIHDNPANGNYDADVACIGRSSSGSTHTDAQGDIVRILGASNLNSNEYLFWGHDGASLTSTTSADMPAGMISRLNREWRVSEVNISGSPVDVGSIDMRFTPGSLAPADVADLRLLVDANNNGSFSDDAIVATPATSLGGGIFQFSDVTAITNNARFTVGTAEEALPIDLLSFSASVERDGIVRLNWVTAAEQNNESFAVERSATGREWMTLTTVAGGNNSASKLEYVAEDTEPLTGFSLYRLRQTDYDGVSSLSPSKGVYVAEGRKDRLHVYPNPATNRLNVETGLDALTELRIHNALGQEVQHLVGLSEVREGGVILDLDNLPRGTYTLSVPTRSVIFYKK
ncbi:T9SS type A sorting domain-containing protein [Lewinella sp. IMCC34183]|uniref:T9SS type A sorting domain-containing protein n=1 Tax=Lewinella sp. IMCC34183 TaxID=2248762 RepID=UPI001300A763|nr:T9SS type A sorting domain-containing protein [Lewinella sp. IMCC34183]